MGRMVWTEAQVAQLRKLARGGAVANEIAEALGCSAKQVRTKAASIGVSVTRPVNARPYTKEEDEQIKRGLINGLPHADIAGLIGRDTKAVTVRISKLRKRGGLQRDLARAAANEAALLAEKPRKIAPLKIKRASIQCRDDRGLALARLSDRVGHRLVGELSDLVGKPLPYSKLSELAARHNMPATRIQSIWHQVRVA